MKKNITPINDKKQFHGYWETYYSNGNLWYKGNYINGKLSGYCEWYTSSGISNKKRYYII